MALLVLGKG